MKFVLDKEAVTSYTDKTSGKNYVKNHAVYYTESREHSVHVTHGSWNEIAICSHYKWGSYIDNKKYYSNEEILNAFCKAFKIVRDKSIKIRHQSSGPWSWCQPTVFPWEKYVKQFDEIIESIRIDELEYYHVYDISTEDLKKVIARRDRDK